MKYFFHICLLSVTALFGQSVPYSSSEIYDDMLRLQNYGSAMYLAAHPDDENTQVISWLTHKKHIDAVYLSLTRGDGGQNLIGAEKGASLGILRTQELLEARNIDGGRQRFTRAIDFGYSKTADETLKIWDENKILADVVWAIRTNQPEVIITRFHPDSNGKTHGHHTASALLAMKAFDLAGDPNAFPEQLQYTSLWKPKRIFFNTSWFFYGSREEFEKADKSDKFSIDTGVYLPHLGVSVSEIAQKSRSKHACQGFGTALRRGSQTEWFEFLKGSKPKTNDLFEGIDFSWPIPEINQLAEQMIRSYDFTSPEKSLPILEKIYLSAQKNNLKPIKIEEIENLILKTQGIYAEWVTEEMYGTKNQKVKTTLELTNRSKNIVQFQNEGNEIITVQPNESWQKTFDYTLTNNSFDSPYWLENPAGKAMCPVVNQKDIGLPEKEPLVFQQWSLLLPNTSIALKIPLKNKTVNPAVGEVYNPFYVLPKVVANFSEDSYLFLDKAKNIEVHLTALEDYTKGRITLVNQNDEPVTPSKSFFIAQKGGGETVVFEVLPNKMENTKTLKAEIEVLEGISSKSMQTVNYPHIKKQVWIKNASAEVQKLNSVIPNLKIGYIEGSGDDIPKALKQIGFSVTLLEDYAFDNLKKFDAVVVGIRAFNVNRALAFHTNDLWDYVKAGGTVIVQYNTNWKLLVDDISPLPLTLGQNRISEEDAELKILAPNHRVFQYPNKITGDDFDNWVQERGLYFADSWDSTFTPLLKGNDTGESPQKGMLLVARVGEGHYVYTGLSFFRELPAGVPGAYRLFINLLSLKEDE